MNKKVESGAVSEEDFEIAFEQTPITEVCSVKELREVMGAICHQLNSDDWQHRVDNLRHIRSVFRGNQVSVDDYIQNLKYMDMELKNCISDLRSQVVREACITVAYLSREMKIKIDSLIEQLLENLINLVPNGVKIMSTSGKIALIIIICNIQSVRILLFFLTSVTSKSTAIRQFSIEIIKSICEQWPMKCLEKNAINIAETLKKGINDADEQARSNAREAFCWFNTKFPSIADKLLQSLDNNKQKTLQKEMSSFTSNSISDIADGGTKDLKVPAMRQVSASVSSPRKTITMTRNRINSARVDSQSTNSSNEYLYVKPQSNFGFRAAKQPTQIPKIDTGESRGRTKVSQSQPASRDASPSTKSNYITYSNGNTAEPAQINSFIKRTTPSVYSSLRYKDVDTEIREKGQRIRRNSGDHYLSDDNASETSSVLSDNLPSFNELIVLLNSKLWSDRKRGLNKTEKYILDCHLKPSERKSLLEFFDAMFLENQTAIVKKFLVVLHLFISKYYEHLNDSLYSLIGKLLNMHSNERLKSCKLEVNKILKLTIDCYGAPTMFVCCCKCLMDKSRDVPIKLKLSVLEFMKMILTLAQPSLLDHSHSDIGPTLGCIVVMTTETRSTELRRLSSSLVVKLFDLNSSQFSQLLHTIPKTFQDRATAILDAYVANNNSKSITEPSSAGDFKSPKQKIDLNKTPDFGKTNTEILQTTSMNSDHFERNSVVSNNSNRSATTTNNIGTYQRVGNYGGLYQTKPAQTPKINSIANNNGPSKNPSSAPDPGNGQRFFPSQASHPDLSIDNSNALQSQGLYPATSNDSSVDNKYNPEYYNSGPIDPSVLSKGDSSSSNVGSLTKIHRPVIGYQTLRKIAELAPEDVMNEILKELSNHNDRHEERKACLFKLIKIFRQNSPTDWVEHFKTLLFLLLESMGDNDADIRAQSLRVLQELAKSQTPRFADYTNLTICKVLEAHNDPDKSVIKAAEECSRVLLATMSRQFCFKMLTDILREGNDNELCLAALKMINKLVKMADRKLIDSNIDNISQGLSIVVNHKESIVRKESILCMVEIHKIIGEEIFSRVTLTTSQKRLLVVYIEKSQT